MKTYLVHPLVESGVIKGAKIVEKPDYCGLTIPCRIDVPCDCYFLQIRHQEALAQSISSALSFENQNDACEKITGFHYDEDSGNWFNADHTEMTSHPPTLENKLYDSLSWRVAEVVQYRHKGRGQWFDGSNGYEDDAYYKKEWDYRTVLRLVEEKEEMTLKEEAELLKSMAYKVEPAQPEAPKEVLSEETVRLLLNDLCESNKRSTPRQMIEIGYKAAIATMGRRKDTSQQELIAELWSLWDNLAEAGQLTVGPKYSANYSRLKKEVETLTRK